MNTQTPREVVADVRAHPRLADGDDERFAGYGVMGLPFASGHYLALRDMVASSIGPAYRSVWHRDPSGHWALYTTTAPDRSCPRYFGAGATTRHVPSINVGWADDRTFEVTMGETLRWTVELASSPATRLMTALSGATPTAAWRSRTILHAIGPMATVMLRAGRIRMCARTPNGPQFRGTPLYVWRVGDSRASLDGETFGAPAPLDEQISIGDIPLPQRGLFFVGRSAFDAPVPTDKSQQHLTDTGAPT
ncbi:hypothetical protein GONAM_09_01330 [Gordonia namibiensis NBRC 108229]|uniref:Uncharacterized protein n=1 Tax=Gordonia namibiensis NBRC 108229 TaxID=1208314 RepID=K6X514_9ACTN|nr:hypothetical protein [Gordonia namibiensis]GAB99487.1 hypothetical protein GONAM_09_01330 [Gordonia namibiensis NBRC 108229]